MVEADSYGLALFFNRRLRRVKKTRGGIRGDTSVDYFRKYNCSNFGELRIIVLL